jgi:hypothetical protein
MAQFNKDTQTYIDGRRILHDVGMISNKNGDIVTTDNRFPVDIQSDPSNVLPFGYGSIHKFGEVQTLSVNTKGTVWDRDDTIYPWSAFDTHGTLVVQVVLPNNESSIQTDDDGGTIEIVGLDSNYDELTETVTISSGTATTINSFKRVFRAYFTASSGYEPSDNRILIKRGSTVVAQITEDFGQTLMAVYTIPDGFEGYLMRIDSTAASSCNLSLYTRSSGTGSFRIQHRASLSSEGGQYSVDYPVPQPLPARTDIDIRAIAGDNNSNVTATFDILLKPTP